MFRFSKDDLTHKELSALRELARTGLLKMNTSREEERKLITLRYARRTARGLMATERGKARAFGWFSEFD